MARKVAPPKVLGERPGITTAGCLSCRQASEKRIVAGRLGIALILGLVMMTGLVLTTWQHSSAMPAFARKYNADCAMCHYPVVPRLNSFGQQFRRAGYRTPTEFKKDQDVTNVSNFLSARVRTQFAYENDKGSIERTEFRFPDVSLIYAGAFSRNFSGYIHAFANNSTNVDVHGHLQGVFGKPDQFFSFRVGQMHMLQQEGVGGFDRPTGISLPPVQALALTNTMLAAGQSLGFNFDLRQKGIELAYVRGRGRLLFQITNGLDATGSGTRSLGDIDTQKDYLVAYEHILDEIASGITVFYYNGTVHGTVNGLTGSATPTGVPSSVANQVNFSRYGVNISKVFPVSGYGFFELQGGFVRSHDNNPASLGVDIEGNAYYVESQQYITGPELTFYERYSWIDLNAAGRNSARKDYTMGVVTPLQTWLRATIEYTYTDNRFSGFTGHLALAELQANW